MSVYFVSRHPGARDWAAAEGMAVDEFIAHLDVTQAHVGDVAIGCCRCCSNTYSDQEALIQWGRPAAGNVRECAPRMTCPLRSTQLHIRLGIRPYRDLPGAGPSPRLYNLMIVEEVS
jgi:hypothetical protein